MPIIKVLNIDIHIQFGMLFIIITIFKDISLLLKKTAYHFPIQIISSTKLTY